MAGGTSVADPKVKERELAELMSKITGFLDKDAPSMVDRIKAVEQSCEPFKGVDVKNVLSEIEKLKGGQEKVAAMIRTNSRHPAFVPGLEDPGETKKFSVLRLCLASRVGWAAAKAEYEKEVCEAAASRLKASGAIGDDKLGGFWVPDQVIPDVIAAIYARSVFFNLGDDGATRVSVLDGLTGGNVKIPKVTGGLVAYWVGEEEEPAESMDQAGDITMNPKKLMMLLKLTDSMRRFGGFGFEQLLRNDMINAAAEKFDYTVAYGNGSADQPRGIINTNGIKIFSAQSKKYGVLGTDDLGGAQFQADWAGADFDFDVLDFMQLALEEDKIRLGPSYASISAPRTFSWLRQLKITNFTGQTADRPYLLGLPVLSDARLTDIIGEWDKSPQIPSDNVPGESVSAPTTSTTAKHSDVFKGNFAEVVVGRWSGIEIEDDQGRGPGFKSDHIYVKMRMYADIGVRQPRALIVCPDAKVRA